MSRDVPRKRNAPVWTLVMAIAASSLSFIDGSILNVALPTIRESTNAGAAEVQWVVNIYTLPLAALILLGGALGDRVHPDPGSYVGGQAGAVVGH